MKRFATLVCLALLSTAAVAQSTKVTLTSPQGTNVKVFTGFTNEAKQIEVTATSTKGALNVYTFELEPGQYHFISSGEGFHRFRKNFNVKGKTLKINADPGRLAGNGYSPVPYNGITDETAARCLSVKALSRQFPKVLSGPAFAKGKAVQEYSTNEEMYAFLKKHDDGKDNMYVYSLGTTTGGRDIPFVVFSCTDLGGKSLEEAAEAVRGNGLPTVYIHAMIHGREPSPTDAALGLIAELDGKYGKKMLKRVNVIISPRVNPDGAKSWNRGTKAFPDLNRDNILARQPEIKATHRAYNLFLPEAVLDMHEYVAGITTRTESFMDDAGITVSGNQNNSKALNDLMLEMMRYTEKRNAKDGIRLWEYVQEGYSDQSPLHASHYYALRGSANFLVETPCGNGQKNTEYARRVFTHFCCAKTIIEFAADNAQRIRSIVAADRAATAAAGEKYDPQDQIHLKYGQNEESYTYTRQYFDMTEGRFIKDSTWSLRYYEVPLISRPRPTAYVLSKSLPKIDSILTTAQYNGITWYEAGKGETMTLRGYEGDGKSATLKDAQQKSFPEGAYIFPMNQPSGIVLGMLMEPDYRMTDAFPVTLLQAGMLNIEDIFRKE